jgi:hypothetical protein
LLDQVASTLKDFIMRSISALTLLASCAALVAPTACSNPAQAQERPLGESATTAAPDTAGTYYAITADLRKCAFPLCGGWFLDRLNQPTTQCPDGRTAEKCYTPELDWSLANLTEDQQNQLLEAASTGAVSQRVVAGVRGTFAPGNTTPRPELGRFVVTEAWVVEGYGPATGTFVWVRDNGLRCFAPPCPNLTERTLNTSQVTDIAEVNFAPGGLTDSEVETCTNAMYGPDGLIVVGERYTVQANGNTAPGRTATGAYLRLSNTQ